MNANNGDIYLGVKPVEYIPGHQVYGVRLYDGSWVSNQDCRVYPVNAASITIG